MSYFYPLIGLVVLAIVFVLVYGKPLGSFGGVAMPYEPAKSLFSPTERAFLFALDRAVADDFRVFGKVRVADVATVKRGLSAKTSRAALNRIAFKHFDYVVCRADDLSIVCVVELNDKTHGSKKAMARDAFVTKVCAAIKLPLLMYPAKHRYDMADIRESLNKLAFPS